MTPKQKCKRIEKASKDFMKIIKTSKGNKYDKKCEIAANIAMKYHLKPDFLIQLLAKHDSNTLPV